jgi:hypothetical protein
MKPLPPIGLDSDAGRAMLRAARGEPQASVLEESVAAGAWTLAVAHGLGPWIARQVLDRPQPWPEEVRRESQAMRHAAIYRNVRLSALLERIRHALDGARAPWISLKGPAFTEQYAGDPSLRASSDLDVLVRPADVPRVHDLFRQIQIEARSPPRPFARILGVRQHEHPYYSAEPRQLVELHWNLASDCYAIVDVETVFRRAKPFRAPAGAFAVPSTEDALLFACLHSLGHRWNRLYHAKAIDWILAETTPDGRRLPRSLDWDYVRYASGKSRKTRAFLLGLAVARRWMDSPLPDSLLDAIAADPALPSLLAAVAANLGDAGPSRSSLRTLGFKWRALETFSDRAGLALRAVVKYALLRSAF